MLNISSWLPCFTSLDRGIIILKNRKSLILLLITNFNVVTLDVRNVNWKNRIKVTENCGLGENIFLCSVEWALPTD